MRFEIGDRVWWSITETTERRGTVREIAERPGVQPDDGETGLLYLDTIQLHQQIPADDSVIYSGISEIDYHADRYSLSSSGARALLPPGSPEIFLAERRQPPDPKPEYDFGHGAHFYLLEEGSQIVEVPFDTWRGGEAKAAREEAWADHKVPLLTKDITKAKEMAAAARKHPLLRQLLDTRDGAAELSGYWRDVPTGLRLRFRTDWLCTRGRVTGLDYKTTTSAYPPKCEKSIGDYGYHMQQAWYEDGLIACGVEDPDFWFAFQSKTRPFPVTVGRVAPHHVDLGRRRNRKAIDLYAECTATNTWPGYGDHLHTFEIPYYTAYRQEEELSA